MSNPKLEQVQKQIEYYMSDKNLKNDKYFHAKISTSKGGLLNLTLLLNCKRIQKFKATIRELQLAIQNSKLLELGADRNCFKRKKKTLPTLREMKVKICLEEGFDPDKQDVVENLIYFAPTVFKLDKTQFFKKREGEREAKPEAQPIKEEKAGGADKPNAEVKPAQALEVKEVKPQKSRQVFHSDFRVLYITRTLRIIMSSSFQNQICI